MSTPQRLWRPSPERVAAANITEFARRVAAATGKPFPDYASLWRWSIDEREAFWRALWDYAGVIGTRGARTLVDASRMPGAHWFPDARLNFAENLLARRPRGRRRRRAGVPRRGQGRAAPVARRAGRARRRALRQALARGGRRRGRSRRGVPAQHAGGDRRDAGRDEPTARSGRRARPTSASQGVLDRFGQIEPHVLFTVDGYWYNGKALPIADKVAQIVARLPTRRARGRRAVPRGERDGGAAISPACATRVGWDEFLAPYAAAPIDYVAPAVRPSAVHPLLVGHDRRAEVHRPRRRRHAAAAPEGAPAARRRQAGDRLFYFTTCGWMMWNWLVSGLAAGATLLLYDGSPFIDRGKALWDCADAERMTHFGTSAKYIDAAKKICAGPAQGLRARGAAHDVLDRQPARAGELRLRLPVREGRPVPVVDLRRHRHRVVLRARQPDAAGVARRDPVPRPRHGGRRLRRRTAGRCAATRANWSARAPFPSMPVGFWNDPDGAKYRARLFRALSRRLVPRRLRRADRARRHDHPRPLGRDAQPRRRAHRHRRDLPAGRAAARDRREPRDRAGLAAGRGGRRARGPVRATRGGRRARRRARRPDQGAHPRQHHAAARAGEGRCRSPTSRAPRATRSSSSRCATSCTACR